MKQILHDMGPLTLVRWPLQKALKVWDTGIQAEKGTPTKNWKNKGPSSARIVVR